MAEAIEKSGRRSEAQRIKALAFEIETNKDFYKKKQTLVAKNQMAQKIQQKKETPNKTNLTDKFSTQINTSAKENKYGEGIRGNIQDNISNLVKRISVLTYYRKTDDLRRTNTYHPTISRYNSKQLLLSSLKATNREIELVRMYLTSILNR